MIEPVETFPDNGKVKFTFHLAGLPDTLDVILPIMAPFMTEEKLALEMASLLGREGFITLEDGTIVCLDAIIAIETTIYRKAS